MVAIGFDLLLFSSMLAASGPTSGAPGEFVKPEIAAQRVEACGFDEVHLKFDDLLQEYVVEVMGIASATEEQLRCAASASLSSHYFVVFPQAISQTYEPLYWRLQRQHSKASARAWLESRGLFSRLQTYDPQRSDDLEFAHSLESLCGPKAAGTFERVQGTITLKTDELSSGRMDEETLSCLLNAAEASGYPLGFVGNEAFQPDK